MDKSEKRKQQEEARKRNREIQAAFRKRHRDRIDDVNIVHRILLRQKRYLGDDVEVLAAALRRLMGQAYIEELRKELATPVVAGGKTKTTTTDGKPKPKRRTKGLTVRQQDAVLHAARKMPDPVKGILSGADTSGKSDWT